MSGFVSAAFPLPVLLGLATGGSIGGVKLNSGTASCQVNINRDGTISVTLVGPDGTTNTGMPTAWAKTLGTTVGDGFYVRCVTDSGTFTVGTADSWLQLNSDRSFGNTRTGLGSSAATGTIQLAADAAGAHIYSSFAFTSTATVTTL